VIHNPPLLRIFQRTLPLVLLAASTLQAQVSPLSLRSQMDHFLIQSQKGLLPSPDATFQALFEDARRTLFHGIRTGFFSRQSRIFPNPFERSVSAFNSDTKECTVFLNSDELAQISQESFARHVPVSSLHAFFTAHELAHCGDGLLEFHKASPEDSVLRLIQGVSGDLNLNATDRVSAKQVLTEAFTKNFDLKKRVGESFADVYALIALTHIQSEEEWQRTASFVLSFREYESLHTSQRSSHDSTPALQALNFHSFHNLRRLSVSDAHLFSTIVSVHGVFAQILLESQEPLSPSLQSQRRLLEQFSPHPSPSIGSWLSTHLLPRFLSISSHSHPPSP
jgi:hypothetical protein